MAFDIEIETNFESFQKKLKWTINNIYKDMSSTVLESPPFSLVPNFSAWIIQLDLQSADSFQVFFKNCDAKNTDIVFVEAKGSIIFKDPINSNTYDTSFRANFKPNGITLFYSRNEFFRQFLRNTLRLQGDVLVIECHMTLYTYTNGGIFREINDLKDMISSNEAKRAIFERSAYPDVVFSFGEKTLKAHKALLTVSSPVFKKMFDHDTLENQTNTIVISDVDLDVFEAFLEFVYTRNIKKSIKSDLDSMLALYEVSDKYEMCDLQKRCAYVLLSSFLNVNSVCKILKLADSHGDSSMKEILLKFLKQKFSEVVQTEEWSFLTTENVKLASEVIAFITQIN